MSGSTWGGVLGAAVGFVASGFNPTGAYYGWMIGAAVGGYIDPDVIKGPRLTDPQQQTSAEGVPRPVVYGTAAVMGNVIQVQSTPTQHKKSQRTNKGGPVQVTYTYTRTAAIRICEAAPLGGEMMLRRAWMNGKLALDRTGSGTIDAESAKLLGQITFYSGSETQLPDPDLESLPASDGGGVGNVPAYRGTCYVVLRNVDVTNGGALPQIMWEVSSAATQGADPCDNPVEWFGFLNSGAGSLKSSPDGLTGWDEPAVTVPLVEGGNFIPTGSGHSLYYNGDILASFATTSGGGGEYRDAFWDGTDWHQSAVGSRNSGDTLQIVHTGTHWMVAKTSASGVCVSTDGMTFSDAGFKSDTLAMVGGSVLSVWMTNSAGPYFTVTVRNGDGSLAATHDQLDTGATSYSSPYMVSGGSTALLVAKAGAGPYTVGVWSTNDVGATWLEHTSPFGSVSATPAFRAHYALGLWFVAVNDRLAIGSSPGGLALHPTTFPGVITGFDDDGDRVLICGVGGFLYSYEGGTLTALDADTSSAFLDVIALGEVGFIPPEGAVELPDVPGQYVTVDGEIVGCGPTSVDPSDVYLSEIVADLCERSEVYEYDVSELSSIVVRGFPITQPVDAAGCINSLQQVYLFDFPEWGDSGEIETKLRAVVRGGSSVATITDNDIVDGDEEETVRRQQVEFPRKVTLFAPDPDANYEATPQNAERESENVKATGEISISTAVILDRDEKANRVNIMQKVLWEEALGTAKFDLPEEFTRLTCSDPIVYDGRRYRIQRTEMSDGVMTVEGTRDRVSAYTSNATGNSTVPIPNPISSLRGPTMFSAMNLPSLKTSDNVPGMYIAVCGMLPGWDGCDLYISVDGGVTEQLVTTIIDPAIMGVLTSDVGAADEPLSIRLYNDDELDSASAAQIAARLNGAAVTTSGVSEVMQFETPTDTGTRTWDLTGLHRARLGTTAASHVTNDSFVLLEQSVVFLPLNISLSGQTLIFRPVSRGTIPENNATYAVVFNPLFTSVTIEELTTGGESITVSGNPIYVVS